MRTTLSLDDDVAVLIKKEMRRTGNSLKETVNELLRLGLMASSRRQARKPFVVTPWPLGVPTGYDNVEELLQALEGPDYK